MITVGLVVIGIVLFSFFAYRTSHLTRKGMVTAIVVGVSIYGGSGGAGLLLLALFFATSSLWSRWKKEKKESDKEEKGSQRDEQQVLANGGVAMVCSWLYMITAQPLWLAGLAGSLAAANADTWASEIGRLSRAKPINIRNFHKVEKGSSGAVSALGTTAAIIGSMVIALPAGYYLANITNVTVFFMTVGITVGGFIGNLIDTLLGSWMEGKYTCQHCGKEVESFFHCGDQTILQHGKAWVNNEVVNVSCTVTGALISMVIVAMSHS